MEFNYTEEVKKDVRRFFERNYQVEDWQDRGVALADDLLERCHENDEVIGVAFHDDETALHVIHNISLLKNAYDELHGGLTYWLEDAMKDIGHSVLLGRWDWLDAMIREYVLIDAVRAVVDELEKAGKI